MDQRPSPRPGGLARQDPPARSSQKMVSWRQQPDISLEFDRMPKMMGVRDVWQVMEKYGTISNITIHEDGMARSRGRGFVRFSPPPREMFWGKAVEFKYQNATHRVGFWVRPPKPQTFSGLVNTERTYPGVLQIEAAYLDIGIMMKDRHVLQCFSTTPFPSLKPGSQGAKRQQNYSFRPITISQHVEYREIQIDFPLHFKDGLSKRTKANRTELFRFVIPLQQRIEVFRARSPHTPAGTVLIFRIETPPTCFRRGDELGSLQQNQLRWSENEAFFRQSDVVIDPEATHIKTRPTSLRQDQSVINLSQWTTYVLEVKGDQASEQYTDFCDCLRDHNIQIQDAPDFTFSAERPTPVWSFIDPPGMTGFDERASHTLRMLSDVDPLDFVVRYQLEVCISGGWFNEFSLSKDFIDRLRAMPPMRACALLEEVATDKPDQKYRHVADPMSVFDWPAPPSSVLSKKRPGWCAMIRSAVITPTTVIVNTPNCEISNRVIRHYREHADRFLRIRFLDERGRGRIYSSVGKSTMNEVFTRVYRTMTFGITIGDRHYDFLAFGNSQFRENGAYFFASTATLDVEKIRHWMGNFDHIKVVAKYAARLGQCFSTTRAMKSAKPFVRKIPDIKRNGFNFTDGVGKISPGLAAIAMQDYNKNAKTGARTPSVFQFRLGGAKGILTTWPDVKGLEVHIRESQDKFTTTKDDLEIIKYSKASEFSLNRQLILVLSSLGVPDQVFHEKMKLQLKLLNKAMHDERVAKETLNSSVDVYGTTIILSEMVSCGFQATREPFMMTMLNLWRAWSVKYLKEKAKIHIAKGAVVLGCTDETQTLKGYYNSCHRQLESDDLDERYKALPEVFLQLTDYEGAGHPQVITGLMIIARNPSLHPGDIRVVRGVQNDALVHLRDCLVLPQTGDRDLPNMCSGGDLDGDDYIVSWDSGLIPKEWDHEAMDFTAPKPKAKEKVLNRDVVSFFVQYMKNADLGNIAYSHLATADDEPLGVKSEKCKQLALVHSNAVDYPKSGQPANIPESLRPKRYPHFMERRRNVYHSRKILGQLYDSVRLVDFNPAYENAFDERILGAYPLQDSQLEAASRLKVDYDTAVRRIMAQHGVKTEFEIWSTFALERNKNCGDFKFSEILGESVTALKDQFSEICYEAAGGREFATLAPFAAAMYRVTQEEVLTALEECETSTWDRDGLQRAPRSRDIQYMPLMSFPWLFPSTLGRIAMLASLHERADEANEKGLTNGVGDAVPAALLPTSNHSPVSTAVASSAPIAKLEQSTVPIQGSNSLLIDLTQGEESTVRLTTNQSHFTDFGPAAGLSHIEQMRQERHEPTATRAGLDGAVDSRDRDALKRGSAFEMRELREFMGPSKQSPQGYTSASPALSQHKSSTPPSAQSSKNAIDADGSRNLADEDDGENDSEEEEITVMGPAIAPAINKLKDMLE